MAFSDVCEAINARFRTQVAEVETLSPVLRDNAPEPTNLATAKWARLRISSQGSQRVGTGGPGANRTRTDGALAVELVVPAKQGAAVVNALVDRTVTAFRDVGLPAVLLRFGSPTASEAQVQGDAWCRRTVTVPFRFDEIT